VGNAVEGHSPPRAQPSPDSSPSGFRLAPSPVAAVRLEPMGLPPVVEAASETESHGRWVPPGPEQGARMRVAVNDMGGRNVFFGSFCTARAPVAMAPAARRMSPFPRLTEAGRQLTKRDGCHWGPVQPRKGVAQAPETARRRPVHRSAPPVSNPGYLGRPARRRDTHGYSYLAALHRDCGRLPSDRGDARTRSTRRGVRSDTELVCVGTPGCAVPRDKEVPRCYYVLYSVCPLCTVGKVLALRRQCLASMNGDDELSRQVLSGSRSLARLLQVRYLVPKVPKVQVCVRARERVSTGPPINQSCWLGMDWRKM